MAQQREFQEQDAEERKGLGASTCLPWGSLGAGTVIQLKIMTFETQSGVQAGTIGHSYLQFWSRVSSKTILEDSGLRTEPNPVMRIHGHTGKGSLSKFIARTRIQVHNQSHQNRNNCFELGPAKRMQGFSLGFLWNSPLHSLIHSGPGCKVWFTIK